MLKTSATHEFNANLQIRHILLHEETLFLILSLKCILPNMIRVLIHNMNFLLLSEKDFFFFSWNKTWQNYKFAWNSWNRSNKQASNLYLLIIDNFFPLQISSYLFTPGRGWWRGTDQHGMETVSLLYCVISYLHKRCYAYIGAHCVIRTYAKGIWFLIRELLKYSWLRV